MKVTKTIKICYLLGIVLAIVGLVLIIYGVSLAEWNDPWAYRHMPPEDWTPQMKDWAKITIHPYRTHGLIILLFGLAVFILVPTITSQIAGEVKE